MWHLLNNDISGEKGKMFYMHPRICVLAMKVIALKQTNVPWSAFHRSFDINECQESFPPTPVPNSEWRTGQHAQIKSQDAKVSAIQPTNKKPRQWGKKTLLPIDGLTEQISRLTIGQRLKVSDRQKSFCHDRPGWLNTDELVWKGLPTWDIQRSGHRHWSPHNK